MFKGKLPGLHKKLANIIVSNYFMKKHKFEKGMGVVLLAFLVSGKTPSLLGSKLRDSHPHQ